MEYNQTCPKEHVIRQDPEKAGDTHAMFRLECDGVEFAQKAFFGNMLNSAPEMPSFWAKEALKEHQIEFLLKECARLAGIIDELEELRH